MSNSELFAKLAAEFPREQISWRAQTVTKDGDKALALAYIDARDVMNRFDEVVGAGDWSDSYDVHPNVTICSIALRIEGGWTSKADGAGDTDVEAEKGRISDAFKRAAVKWGVGRYLYAIPSTWVPCETYTKGDKSYWKRWTADPWDYVKLTAKPPRTATGGEQPELATSAAQPHWTVIAKALEGCTTRAQLTGEWGRHEPVFALLPENFREELKEHFLALREKLPDPKKLADLTETQKHALKVAQTP